MEFLTLNWFTFLPLGIGIVLVLITALFIFLAVRDAGRDWFFDSGWGLSGLFLGLFAVTLTIIGAIVLIPYDHRYWSIYQANGTVLETTNSFVNGSGDLTTGSAIVVVDGVSERLIVRDERLTGQADVEVTVNCSLEWVPYGADRYNCWLG